MAKKKSICKREWKIADCGVPYDCWCRIIVAADAKPKETDGEYYMKDTYLSAGLLSKKEAEYFVKLHNESLGG